MSLIQVKDNPSLFRDQRSHAILNADDQGYKEYLFQHEKLKQQQEMILNNVQEVKNLKEEVSEIKMLLQQIAIKLQGKE